MFLPDINVLVYAHRRDTDAHQRFGEWLERARRGSTAVGLCTHVTTGFVRVVTNPRVFPADPTPAAAAVAFVDALRASPGVIFVEPGPAHWQLFTRLVQETGATANRVPDASLAALAIEKAATLVSADRGFGAFRDLAWTDRP